MSKRAFDNLVDTPNVMKAGVDLGGFTANGYDHHSPGGYSLAAALPIEAILTAFVLFIILGVMRRPASCL